jgi:hypothetical protein
METKRKESTLEQSSVKKSRIYRFDEIPKDSIAVILSFCSSKIFSCLSVVNKMVYNASQDPMAYSMETFIGILVKKEIDNHTRRLNLPPLQRSIIPQVCIRDMQNKLRIESIDAILHAGLKKYSKEFRESVNVTCKLYQQGHSLDIICPHKVRICIDSMNTLTYFYLDFHIEKDRYIVSIVSPEHEDSTDYFIALDSDWVEYDVDSETISFLDVLVYFGRLLGVKLTPNELLNVMMNLITCFQFGENPEDLDFENNPELKRINRVCEMSTDLNIRKWFGFAKCQKKPLWKIMSDLHSDYTSSEDDE